MASGADRSQPSAACSGGLAAATTATSGGSSRSPTTRSSTTRSSAACTAGGAVDSSSRNSRPRPGLSQAAGPRRGREPHPVPDDDRQPGEVRRLADRGDHGLARPPQGVGHGPDHRRLAGPRGTPQQHRDPRGDRHAQRLDRRGLALAARPGEPPAIVSHLRSQRSIQRSPPARDQCSPSGWMLRTAGSAPGPAARARAPAASSPPARPRPDGRPATGKPGAHTRASQPRGRAARSPDPSPSTLPQPGPSCRMARTASGSRPAHGPAAGASRPASAATRAGWAFALTADPAPRGLALRPGRRHLGGQPLLEVPAQGEQGQQLHPPGPGPFLLGGQPAGRQAPQRPRARPRTTPQRPESRGRVGPRPWSWRPGPG